MYRKRRRTVYGVVCTRLDGIRSYPGSSLWALLITKAVSGFPLAYKAELENLITVF
jgi:hypothetical protein